MGMRQTMASQSRIDNPIPPKMAAANIPGKLNTVMWSSYFTFSSQMISPAGTYQATINVTQEAALLWRYIMVSVFEVGVDGAPILIEGDDLPVSLKMTITDPQSSRTFHDVPETLFSYNPDYPYYLSTPIFLLPNYSMQINLSYEGGQPTQLQPIMTAFGYRVRIPESLKVSQKVTAAE